MKTDFEIQKEIREELKWDSMLNGSTLEVEVIDGHVTLRGSIDSYPRKIQAELSAVRIRGVKSLSNELKIKIPSGSKRADSDIKKGVLDVIKWNSSIKENKIKAHVNCGWVTLEGSVDWEYQRSKARLLAEDITGVVGVTNLINVASTFASSTEVKEEINAALKRNSFLKTEKIEVDVENGKAILSGEVRTLGEKMVAESATWSAPGITEVVNELVVDFSEELV